MTLILVSAGMRPCALARRGSFSMDERNGIGYVNRK